ncbi:MAG: response regulator [Balneolaceae bacterium]|jgi:CheY-like chemotaxis protein|nr:MAG: response regulator [Balneolaceae bacterium]
MNQKKAVILSYLSGIVSEHDIWEEAKGSGAGKSNFSFSSRSFSKIRAKTKPKLLHIEDLSQIRMLVSVYLKQFYDVTSIDNIENFDELIENESYDAFLIDINLGSGLDGFDLIKKIRAHNKYKKTTVIVLTVFEYDYVRDKCIALKVNAYLQKPFQKNIIIQTLSEINSHS